jgi:hypothetical protein
VPDAVFLGDFEIQLPQPVAVDGDAVDNEARALEGGAAVGGRFYFVTCPAVLVE